MFSVHKKDLSRFFKNAAIGTLATMSLITAGAGYVEASYPKYDLTTAESVQGIASASLKQNAAPHRVMRLLEVYAKAIDDKKKTDKVSQTDTISIPNMETVVVDASTNSGSMYSVHGFLTAKTTTLKTHPNV